jgi:peptide/nickel transport system ATP-binding protein
MYAGQIVEVAPAAEFFSAPRHPYAQALLRALPDARRAAQPLAAIAGTVPPLLTQAFAGCRFAPRCDQAMPHCAGTPPVLLSSRSTRGAVSAVRPKLDTSARTDGAALSQSDCSPCPRFALAAGAGRTPPTHPRPCSQVQDLSVRFPIRGGLLQRTAGNSTPCAACPSTSRAGARWRWSVNRAAARRPPARPSCSCCGRGQIDGRALLDGRNLFELQGDRCGSAAAQSRSSSRTRSPR